MMALATKCRRISTMRATISYTSPLTAMIKNYITFLHSLTYSVPITLYIIYKLANRSEQLSKIYRLQNMLSDNIKCWNSNNKSICLKNGVI